MRPWAARNAASASPPAKTKAETPACVSSPSSAPGRPASQTTAPADFTAPASFAKNFFAAGRLDAAGGKEVLGEACRRGEVGGRAEIGEEDFRPCARAREHPIGSVAKRFERFGETNARQRFERQRGGR